MNHERARCFQRISATKLPMNLRTLSASKTNHHRSLCVIFERMSECRACGGTNSERVSFAEGTYSSQTLL